MKLNKKISIKVAGDAEEAYEKLNKIVGEQKTAGKITSEEIKLWKAIHRIFDLLVVHCCIKWTLRHHA